MTELLNTISMVDVLILLGLFAFFILGWAQGTIRRLIGIASMAFSFFLAAVLHVPFGRFLTEHWTQFPPEYSVMIGFLTLFVAGVVATTLVIQGTYSKTEIFAEHPIVDEVLGGVLGVVQGFLLLMFVTIILDQFFLYTNIPPDADELPFLRDIWTQIDASAIGQALHETIIPVFLSIFSFIVPASVTALYDIG
ncbi:MAG: CvpA family protein [Chloroflexi bacterium]|nr:CvpA family protein [Chloroflexota bacterium]